MEERSVYPGWFITRFIQKESPYLSLSVKSFIDLSQPQRALLSETLDIISRFQAQEGQIIIRGRSLAESLTEREVAQLMEKARLNSPNANANSLDQTKEDLLAIIQSNPGISTPEIHRDLQARGYTITDFWVRSILRNMKNNGELLGQKQGKYMKWSILTPGNL